jgi:hypothetical protein
MISDFLVLDELIEKIVKQMRVVERAHIVGDYAKGRDSGTVEVILTGKILIKLT